MSSTHGSAQNLRPAENDDTRCESCAAKARESRTPPTFVYAIGKIEPRFPRLSVEKEFAQALGRADTVNLTDRGSLAAVLKERRNRYLVRQLCWVLKIGNLETYLLLPRDPADYALLVDSLRVAPDDGDLDIVVGLKGPLAPPDMCNGLVVPVVVFDQIYSFEKASLIKSIPKAPNLSADADWTAIAAELLDRVMLLADNAGGSDEHRAVNYLSVRYPGIYHALAEQYAVESSLTSVDVQPSPLSGIRKIVEVILSFTNRKTGVVQKQGVRVDVTDEFPFLVTRLSPTYDR